MVLFPNRVPKYAGIKLEFGQLFVSSRVVVYVIFSGLTSFYNGKKS